MTERDANQDPGALIDLVYHAATEGGWERVTKQLASLCGARAAVIACRLAGSAAELLPYGILQRADRQQLGRRMARWESQPPTVDADPDQGETRHPLDLPLQLPNGDSALLMLVADGHGRPVDLAACDELKGHLERALAIHCRLRRAEDQADVAAAVLDRVTFGAVLVDARARPLLANRAAMRMARQRDGLAVGPLGLYGGSPEETRLLHELVAAAASHEQGPLSERGGALTFTRPSKRTPYEVLVLPVPGSARREELAGAAAVVFITDPERRVDTPESFLRELYGLTPAEARLAVLLAKGLDLNAAADHLDVAPSTARSHLKALFLKTGTTRQSELVRRLLTAPVRLASEESSGRFPVLRDE